MRKLLGLLLIAIPTLTLAQNGINGTWRFDPNKAKLDSKPQVYELKDGKFNCSTCDPKINIKADGLDHKVSGSPYTDVETVSVVDDNMVERIGSKKGKVTFHEVMTISADGKTLTEKIEYHPFGSEQEVDATATSTRVGQPEAGAHLLTGSWKPEKYTSLSDNAMTFTYTSNGESLSYSAKSGENYTAKFDGKDHPYKGDPGTTSVSVTKIDDNTYAETYKRNGEVIAVSKLTVSADGKSLTAVYEDKRRGKTDTWVAEKDETAVANK